MVKITIVRHGETEWNKTMQLQGFKDSPLTKKGIQQAELLAETIKERTFDILITSDLYRAEHTANIINKYLNLEIIKHSSLRERSFGIMEGMTREEIEKKHATTYNSYVKRTATFEIPGGESLVAFNKRVMDTFEQIINIYANKKILVVAHGGVLDCVIRYVFRLNLDDSRKFTIYNTSVNTFLIENNNWILDEWGNIGHLSKLAVLNEHN
jgi:2,3-bisphosphoglycerate-dependent phosphoglycerate mutase